MSKKHHIKVSTPRVEFPIVVEFNGCEVDMALRESTDITPVPSILCDSAQIPIDESKLDRTPTSSSVNFCLNWLAGYVDRKEMKIQNSKWDKDYSSPPTPVMVGEQKCATWATLLTELEELGLEVTGWNELTQGQCSLTCECSAADYNQALVFKAHHIVMDVFEKYVMYHK